nr:immunoglobulin light chain junction region [Mus musculus]NSM00954.1 immunoglobulin light chain junction region [Mus musculus]NSM02048.1 immunoglobulin light chain junction region [Mus musculus]NSM02888.1 immunoglobulin light chain junction region [Mus musculus]
CQQLYSTPYTF